MPEEDGIVSAIAETGICVVPEFLPEEVAADLLEEALRLDREGAFRPAGVGRRDARAVVESVRGDRILWLDPQALSPPQAEYWRRVDDLRRALNERLFLGLVELEAHYAIYPAGAGYQKHVDRFSDAGERSISLSLYLNQSWRREDGGQLRVYLGDDTFDLLPTLGTLAVFRSDTVPHEVLPACRERISLTGWLKRRSLGGLRQ